MFSRLGSSDQTRITRVAGHGVSQGGPKAELSRYFPQLR
jgi:hypothetical protein